MTRRLLAVLATVAVLGTGLTACTSSGTPGAGASASSDVDPQQALAVGRRLAQCARDHGYPNFPDPVLDGDRLAFQGDAGPNIKDQLKTLEQEVPECAKIMEEMSGIGARQGRPTPGAADMAKLQAFAKCMREQGIDGFPDPKPDGTFPLTGTPLESEGKSERVLTALDACKHLYDGKIAIS